MKMASVILILTLGVFSRCQDSDQQVCRGFCSEYKERPLACTEEYNPVCGSDSRSYSNKCYFCQAVYDNLGSLCFEGYGAC